MNNSIKLILILFGFIVIVASYGGSVEKETRINNGSNTIRDKWGQICGLNPSRTTKDSPRCKPRSNDHISRKPM